MAAFSNEELLRILQVRWSRHQLMLSRAASHDVHQQAWKIHRYETHLHPNYRGWSKTLRAFWHLASLESWAHRITLHRTRKTWAGGSQSEFFSTNRMVYHRREGAHIESSSTRYIGFATRCSMIISQPKEVSLIAWSSIRRREGRHSFSMWR